MSRSSEAHSNTDLGQHSDALASLIGASFQTTGGIVGLLLIVQFLTGVLLAFYYVPSVDHAHTTVSFIEKVLSGGSWIRSLHHHGSQLLPVFLFLHIIRLFWQEAYNYATTHWIATVIMLGLVMAAGATGYSLPWDARAFFSTRVAEGLLAGIPLVGRNTRLWMLGGSEISTLTLSRLFALHVLITPFLILTVVVWRFRGPKASLRVCWPNLSRQAVAAGLVFLGLAIWSMKVPAPLGPSVLDMTTAYLPRPGAQFLWLYQSLKYIPGSLGSLVGTVLPGIVLLILVLIPWLDVPWLRKLSTRPQRLIAGLILACSALLVLTMTTLSYLSDRRDPRTAQQLARQAAQENAFRKEPFKPILLNLTDDQSSRQITGPVNTAQEGPPPAYTKLCATCHGERGEGARQGTLRFPPLLGVSAKPRRTVDDIVNLLNNPKDYGLEPPMKSFATKLTEQEKREIAEWIVTLK